MITNYFGTDLRDCGHYFWNITGDGTQIYSRNIDFKAFPFNPENLTDGYSFGRVQFRGIGGYSVCCIDGSPKDKRPGSKAVFWVKGQYTKEQLYAMMQATPVVVKILQAMPFEIKWGFDVTGEVKTVGIVCDNYKLKKFKEDLTARGFTDLTVTPFTKDSSTIKILTTEDKVFKIETICKAIEMHFKSRN